MSDRPKMPWYRWFASDWLSSETRLGMDLAERGAYRDLLDYHYQEGSIPGDPAALARFLGVGIEEFEGLWKRVGPKFQPDSENPGRLVNEKAVKVLAEAEEYRRKQAEKGRLGGRPRKSQPKAGEKLRVSSGFEKPKAKRKPNESPHSTPEEEEHTARSQANGAVRESASPKKPAKENYPDWFEAFWREYPGARTGDAGGKKAGYEKARNCLSTDEERSQAVSVLRAELKRRQAAEKRGEFVPRLPHVERWFWKDYHGPAAERMAHPPIPAVQSETAFKRSWEQ